MVFADKAFDQVFRPTVNGPIAEHLDMLRRFGRDIDVSDQLPECPPELEHIWNWYQELRNWSRQGFSGAHSLVWSDADAWARRMSVNPRPSEWRLLMQLDGRFRAAAEKHKPKEKTPPRRGR